MRILFAFDKNNFDPDSLRTTANNSMGIFTQALYWTCRELGSVKYIDANEPHRAGEYDLLMSAPGCYSRLTSTNEFDVAVCFRDSPRVSSLYGVAANSISAAMTIVPGNLYTRNNFINSGYEPENLEIVSYGMPGYKFYFKEREKDKTKIFLYMADVLNEEFGFHHAVKDFLEAAIPNSRLVCVGNLPEDNIVRHFIRGIDGVKNILILPEINPDFEQYNELLLNADFFFYPSATSQNNHHLLRAMASGIIPIVSDQCGVDFIGRYQPGSIEILRQMAMMDEERFKYLQQVLYESIITRYNIINFKTSVRGILEGLL